MPRSPDSSEILSAIRAAARQLGRPPTRSEFTRLSGISHFKVLACFSSLREAVRQAGFQPNPQGLRISSCALLQDWAEVARTLGCLPSRSQYLRHGRYSAGVFTLRFGSWTSVPQGFARFVREGGLEDEWKDVLGLIKDGHVEDDRRRDAAPPRLTLAPASTPTGHDSSFVSGHDFQSCCNAHLDSRALAPTNLRQGGSRRGNATSLPPPVVGQRCVTRLVLALIVNTLAPPESEGVQLLDCQLTRLPILDSPPGPSRPLLRGRPLLGAPLTLPGLAYEPVNETGVVFLFGMLAHRLGFQVESLQAGFPDCEATHQIQPGKWQRVRIEFEFESRNFQTHRHPAEGCDVIVCWRNNWLDCPETLEVVELRKFVQRL